MSSRSDGSESRNMLRLSSWKRSHNCFLPIPIPLPWILASFARNSGNTPIQNICKCGWSLDVWWISSMCECAKSLVIHLLGQLTPQFIWSSGYWPVHFVYGDGQPIKKGKFLIKYTFFNPNPFQNNLHQYFNFPGSKLLTVMHFA